MSPLSIEELKRAFLSVPETSDWLPGEEKSSLLLCYSGERSRSSNAQMVAGLYTQTFVRPGERVSFSWEWIHLAPGF